MPVGDVGVAVVGALLGASVGANVAAAAATRHARARDLNSEFDLEYPSARQADRVRSGDTGWIGRVSAMFIYV